MHLRPTTKLFPGWLPWGKIHKICAYFFLINIRAPGRTGRSFRFPLRHAFDFLIIFIMYFYLNFNAW